MFLGHFAVGLASKRAAPQASLGVLLAAAQWLDLIWPVFVLAGWERVRIAPGDTAFTPLEFVSYPISHSLLTVLAWSAALAAVYWTCTRYRAGAVVVFAGVLSHWVLDLVTHRPNLPLYPGGPRVGLGLWNSVAGTVAVESLMFAAGVGLYTGRRRGGFWALVAVLAVLYAGAAAGPPPPSGQVVALTGLAACIFPVWAWWIDRGRAAV
jgi:membrane-bound metal-dependent hydrolase YbcI (DUF457 family)